MDGKTGQYHNQAIRLANAHSAPLYGTAAWCSYSQRHRVTTVAAYQGAALHVPDTIPVRRARSVLCGLKEWTDSCGLAIHMWTR